jgi:hypothetical protein
VVTGRLSNTVQKIDSCLNIIATSPGEFGHSCLELVSGTCIWYENGSLLAPFKNLSLATISVDDTDPAPLLLRVSYETCVA